MVHGLDDEARVGEESCEVVGCVPRSRDLWGWIELSLSGVNTEQQHAAGPEHPGEFFKHRSQIGSAEMLQDVETHDPGRRAGLNRHCADVRAEDYEERVSAAG